jgi:hypothetical protein
MTHTLYVIIGCDTDPDRPRFFDGIPPYSERLSWRGLTEGIPRAKELLHGVRDSRGREPVFTWVLRADEQVRQLEGDYAWCMQRHGDLLRSLETSGDEVGWHPHFWRREAARGDWFQEIEDIDWQVEMLHEAHRALSAAFPAALASVRMGWSYHNNRTYQTLERLGLTVDFSAVPGMRTLTPRSSTRAENLFDWSPTPRSPYFPSRADYRRPAADGETSCRLLQAPSFVSTSRLWGLVSGVQLARKTGDPGQFWRALQKPTYVVNVTARPRLFAPMVAQLRGMLRQPGTAPLVFVTQLHADELVPNKSGLYSLESMLPNIRALLQAGEEASIPVQFIPAGRLPALWPN